MIFEIILFLIFFPITVIAFCFIVISVVEMWKLLYCLGLAMIEDLKEWFKK